MDINKIIEQHALWLKTGGRKGCIANLEGANLEGLNLGGANLERANLFMANLSGANLSGANLAWANLRGANLNGSHIDRANLTRANMKWADLRGADLSESNLTEVNLTFANLDKANISGANLYRTIGDMEHVKSVFCETYPVTYTAEVMQIGCESHRIEDWMSFEDARIIEIGGKEALEWCRTWKPLLQQIIEASPAAATGYVDNKL